MVKYLESARKDCLPTLPSTGASSLIDSGLIVSVHTLPMTMMLDLGGHMHQSQSFGGQKRFLIPGPVWCASREVQAANFQRVKCSIPLRPSCMLDTADQKG